MKKYNIFINNLMLEGVSKFQSETIDKIMSYLYDNTDIMYFQYEEKFVIKKPNEILEGTLYLMDDGRALRINFEGDILHSLDLWQLFKFDNQTIMNHPFYTMEPNTNDVDEYLDDIVDFINEDFSLNESDNDTNVEFKKADDEVVKFKSLKLNKAVLNNDLDVFDAINMYVRQVAYGVSNSLIISGDAGVGKCLGKGTKIIMFDGTLKNVEDIICGDLLMGPDSKSRLVMSTNSGVSEMYEINQKKGIKYIVNDEHILSLKKSIYAKNNNRNSKFDDILNIPINEYIKKDKTFKRNFLGYKVDIKFDENELPIEPYYLGIWLGDGTSEDTSVTNVDIEIENYLFDYAERIGMIAKKYEYENDGIKKTTKIKIISEGYHDKGVNYINPLYHKMKYLNIIKNKHIPNIYINNSEKNRLELLAGLIDSDGYKINGGYEITLKSETLIENVKFLADTIGFKTSLKNVKRSIKKLNFEGDYFRLSIYGDVDRIPLKLERKKVYTIRRVDHKVTGIDVKSIGIGEYYGFVINDDHLFLLEDCTVTHNTSEVTEILDDTRLEYEFFKGDITKSGLYETLFVNNGKLLVFDDCDAVFQDTDSVNLLKSALDTKKNREISRILKTHYDSKGLTYKEMIDKYNKDKKLPKQFVYNGRCIFITNIDGDKMDKALVSRSLHVDVKLTRDEIIERLKRITEKIYPRIPNSTKEETIEFVDFMTKGYKSKFPLSIRTIIHALNIRVSNDFMIDIDGEKVPAWQMLVKQFLIEK